MNLLLISLQALDAYNLETINYNDTNHSSHIDEHIYNIRFKKYIKNLEKNSTYTFQEIIILIYNIQYLFSKSSIRNIIYEILMNSYKDKTSIINIQYLKKFHYIYNKTSHYYYMHSHENNKNLTQIALTNLYMIYKINYKEGIYFFIKYLCL
uniref:Uncharacterized protein n=1 Tax=Plocamium cartilagineum TaxID=31452 RepID=A0A1C9CHX7_PLOCA|nr:hypothetical protein Plocam_139 [Plocamium cartilagineum]AOM67975.1 hypothetical protein Plocam_139 [Plocamium cartilagineum]